MKALILSRVSSKEQEEGYAIAAQTDKLKAYCLRKGLDVLKIFEITESSTVGDRKQFRDMIAYAKERQAQDKQRIAIVVDAVDRLMRNFMEQPLLNDLMQQDVIELHFGKDGSVIHKDSTSTEKLFWNFQIMMAQSYVDSLRDNVKRSIDYKLKKGECIHQAPLGYLNVPKQQRKETSVILDENRCFLVKRLFQEYATGAYNLADITAMAKKWGLRSLQGNILTKATIHKMLQNPFYIGDMRVKGELIPHHYPRIIDEIIYSKCQQVRAAARKKPFKYAEKPFLFRGLIKCAECGCSYSSYRKKGLYTYLRPVKSKNSLCTACKPIREEVALTQIENVLASIRIPESLLVEIREHLRQSHKAKEIHQEQLIHNLRKEEDGIRRKLDRLVDLLIDQSITRNEYDTKVYALKGRQEEITRLLSGHSKADETFYYTLSALVELTSRAHEYFQCSQMEQKRKLIGFVFANLALKEETLCYSYRKPFDVLAELSVRQEWRTRRDSNSRPSDP